jgi:hypothetical protein
MWCTCRSKTSFTVAILDDESVHDLWVCSTCRKPTRMVFEKLTGLMCPFGATALLAVRSRPDGINELTWATPDGRKTTLHFAAYPRKLDMPEQATLLNTLWSMLDYEIDEVMSPGAIDREYSKTRSRALCDGIAVLMAGFYADSDAVAREGLARHKARADGTEHETPGLAESIWDPHTRWDGTPLAPETPQKARPIAKKIENNTPLPPEAIPAVKKALETKMMTISQIAAMYKVSEATVFAAVGS